MGEKDEATLESGAVVSVWPQGKLPQTKLQAKKKGLQVIVANGSEVEYFGQKLF